ncbi:MAG: hypothetical protein K2O42_04800 [Oscillospiraceae bacterium]|nr:hypothetical protein [Oscillospiraceae bacterium]
MITNLLTNTEVVYTITDIAGMLLIGVITGILLFMNLDLIAPFFTTGLLLFWNLIQVILRSHMIRNSVQTTANLVEYQSKLIRIYRKNQEPEEYYIHAPVMCYETQTEILESVSCAWTRHIPYKKDVDYLICYSLSKPSFFWFPEQEKNVTLPYITGMCISAVFFIIWLAVYTSA